MPSIAAAYRGGAARRQVGSGLVHAGDPPGRIPEKQPAPGAGLVALAGCILYGGALARWLRGRR